MTKRLSTQASHANIQAALQMLRSAPPKLEALGRRLTAQQLDQPPSIPPYQWGEARHALYQPVFFGHSNVRS